MRTKTDQESESWNFIARKWLDREEDRLWREHSDALNIALLENWLPRRHTMRLLKTDLFDEGVSSGLYSYISSRSRYVFGIDVSERMAAAVQSSLNQLHCACGDVRCLPFVDDAFECVLSNSTLDHFPAREGIEGALSEIFRVLKPGGELIITLDNPHNPILVLRRLIPNTILRGAGILPYYMGETLSMGGLRRTLKKTGFELMQETAVMHCPRVFAVYAGNFIRRLGNRKVEQVFLRVLMAFERLSRLPTRFITGHFVAARALKRDDEGRRLKSKSS